VFAGVLSILAIQTGGPWFRSPFLWFALLLGLTVTGFGAALFHSGTRRAGAFIGALTSTLVALALLVLTTASLVVGVVPVLFLLDTALEFMFVCWWAVAACFTYQSAPVSRPS
jgi:hypothetical protein